MTLYLLLLFIATIVQLFTLIQLQNTVHNQRIYIQQLTGSIGQYTRTMADIVIQNNTNTLKIMNHRYNPDQPVDGAGNKGVDA
jgi:predicted PurR-regulated permease PerM